MPKCKYAGKKKWNAPGASYDYCYCKSPKAESRSMYSAVTSAYGYPVMGCVVAPKKPGNWWTLCIDGKADENGRTPSRCDYYK
jgi:hypothetical protein